MKQVPPESYKKSKLITMKKIIQIPLKQTKMTNQYNEKNKRIQNLFRNLQKDSKSVFYSISNLSRALLNKAKKSTYGKYIVFVNLYNQLEDKSFYQKNNNLTLVTLFVNKRSNIDHSTLYSISKPFDLLNADIADLIFLAKSTVDPKHCLLIADLFTSKIYVYPMKNRSLLTKKLNLFYSDVKNKRTDNMHLQTDLEFNQNQIKNSIMILMWRCFTRKYVEERHLLQNRKLENLEKLY